ncbi:hypothetical protein [Agromyces sp. NPDC055658]
MNADDLAPVPVDEHAPPLPEGQEWVTPRDRPDDRLVVFTVPDDAPPLVREGLVRRRVQAVEGVCPCGGRMIWPDEAPAVGTLGRVVAQHLGDCPAGDAVMIPALEAWRRERGD